MTFQGGARSQPLPRRGEASITRKPPAQEPACSWTQRRTGPEADEAQGASLHVPVQDLEGPYNAITWAHDLRNLQIKTFPPQWLRSPSLLLQCLEQCLHTVGDGYVLTNKCCV